MREAIFTLRRARLGRKEYLLGYCHSVGGVRTALWTLDTPIVRASEFNGIMVELVPVKNMFWLRDDAAPPIPHVVNETRPRRMEREKKEYFFFIYGNCVKCTCLCMNIGFWM